MIKIIKGTFGYYNGRKVVPITEKDGPQKFDPELEARLVKRGIAECIDDTPVNNDSPGDATQPEETETSGEELPEYSEDMKLEELKEIAAAYGVDASAMRKKADVIAAIEASKQETDADDEEPPQFGAADPV